MLRRIDRMQEAVIAGCDPPNKIRFDPSTVGEAGSVCLEGELDRPWGERSRSVPKLSFNFASLW